MTSISLPITDRQRAHDFYATGFGLEALGPLAEDGIPEPLRFDIDGTSVLLIPTGGFNWAIGDRRMTDGQVVGCLMDLVVASDAEVDDIAQRAEAAGATMVVTPTRQPWGEYAATFADPDGNMWMATSTAPAPD